MNILNQHTYHHPKSMIVNNIFKLHTPSNHCFFLDFHVYSIILVAKIGFYYFTIVHLKIHKKINYNRLIGGEYEKKNIIIVF